MRLNCCFFLPEVKNWTANKTIERTSLTAPPLIVGGSRRAARDGNGELRATRASALRRQPAGPSTRRWAKKEMINE